MMINSQNLIQYAVYYEGSWDRIARAVITQPQISYRNPIDKAVTILDPQYPSCLKQLRYPPWVLFYKGNISILNKPMITIVGSRNLSPYGSRMTRLCADILKEKFVLVSGLARGADTEVHAAALKGGHTIGVIGSGLGTIYPADNKELYHRMAEHDLILSEYPHHTGVKRHHFPWRNRILAALGESIIVTQAERRSGTLLTVNEAISLSKDIWCIPYSLNEPGGSGCNYLIAQGAGMLYDTSLLKDFMPGCLKY